MASVIVYHAFFGCDTGCCGHVVELGDDKQMYLADHPDGEDPQVFAEALVRREFGDEHVKDLDWANCFIEDGEDH